MQKILDELFFDGFRPCEQQIEHNGEYTEALERCVESERQLAAQLTPEEQKMFEQYMQDQRALALLEESGYFKIGFRFGARMMRAVSEEDEA